MSNLPLGDALSRSPLVTSMSLLHCILISRLERLLECSRDTPSLQRLDLQIRSWTLSSFEHKHMCQIVPCPEEVPHVWTALHCKPSLVVKTPKRRDWQWRENGVKKHMATDARASGERNIYSDWEVLTRCLFPLVPELHRLPSLDL
jgi:hypothetical protein